MLDPISIGLAFTAAQAAVSHIKQAIALGKDINGLVGQFSKFFESADAIHKASIQDKIRGKHLGKTDAELGHLALQRAMHSDALREAERELKDMIIWQLGKPQIWEQMLKERVRLIKERSAAEKLAEEEALAHKKKMAKQAMFAMYFIGFAIFAFCVIMGGVQVYGITEEKRVYEQKVAQRNALIYRQAKEREALAKKELDDYTK